MRRILPAAGVVVLLLAAAAPAQESGIVPVATVKQLCEGMITASSDALFNVGREAPDDDDDWRAVLHSALMLAEAGNLLMLEGRARDDGEWMTMSRALVDAGVAAVPGGRGARRGCAARRRRPDRGGVRDVPRAVPRRGPVDAGALKRCAGSHAMLPRVIRTGRRLVTLTVLVAAGLTAPRLSAQDPPGQLVPEVGREGKDVVWVPSPDPLVDTMLDIAGVTDRDVLMDLGSGDGRLVIAAAGRGARAVGIE